MITVARVTAISVLVLSTVVVGCARRLSVTSMATAPSPAPTAAAQAGTEAPAAAPETSAAIAIEERRWDIVVAQRREPATFTENADVKPIYFDFNRYEIRPADANILESDAAWLKTHDVLILVEGQCDERGTDEYNLALGERRARATLNYLVALGVAADRMSTVSYGKERPVCAEHAEACWPLNRRAHIVVRPRG